MRVEKVLAEEIPGVEDRLQTQSRRSPQDVAYARAVPVSRGDTLMKKL